MICNQNENNIQVAAWRMLSVIPKYCYHLVKFITISVLQDCVVLDSDQHEVFLAVKSPDTQKVNLYVSDVTGRFYVKTLDNIRHIPFTEGFYMDFAEVLQC